MTSIFNSLGSNYDRPSGAYQMYIGGKHKRQQLRDLLKHHYGSQDVQLVYKGREALALALQALHLPAGSWVAINGYTCYAVYEAVVAAGFKPWYLDISRDELDFSAQTLQEALASTSHIAAVIIQNSFGIPADLVAIQKVCALHQLPIIEDMAHCVGMHYSDGSEAGTQTEAAALSFSQDKMIDAVTGGALLLRQGQITAQLTTAGLRIRATARIYPWLIGFVRQTHHLGLGKALLKVVKKLKLIPGPMSGKALPLHTLPNWNAGLALKSFERLDHNTTHRQQIAAIYRRLLPAEAQFRHHDGAVYLRFPLKVDEPVKLTNYLKHLGIELGTPWYDAPVAPKRLFVKTDYRQGRCPNAEWMSKHMINLPTHAYVTEEAAQFIAERISTWLQSTPNQ